MRFTSILAALPLIGAAFAQTNHVVLVGSNGTLTYSPTEVTAANGDTVSFQLCVSRRDLPYDAIC